MKRNIQGYSFSALMNVHFFKTTLIMKTATSTSTQGQEISSQLNYISTISPLNCRIFYVPYSICGKSDEYIFYSNVEDCDLIYKSCYKMASYI